MNAKLRLYYLFHGRRYVYLNLEKWEVDSLLSNGFIVMGGRWFFKG